MSTQQPEQNPEQNERKQPEKFAWSEVRLRGARPKIQQLMKYNQDGYRQLLTLIRQGVYDYVAAEAIGITLRTWVRWLKEGENAPTGSWANQFFLDVMQARSQARVTKELQVAKDDPKFWLRSGPGKTRLGRPGWTENVGIVGDEDAAAVQHEVEHVGSITHREEATVDDLAQSLLVMEELGMISISEHIGRQIRVDGRVNPVQYSDDPDNTVEASGVSRGPVDPARTQSHDATVSKGQPGHPLSPEIPPPAPTPVPDDDWDDEDFDDEDGIDRGYNPEHGQELTDIEKRYYFSTPEELDPRNRKTES